MDALKDKSYKQHTYVSRYQSFPFYYNSDDRKYIYGLTSNLVDSISYVAHKVKETDSLDSLALKYYGRPDYWWIIADFNRIKDSTVRLYPKYKTIKIPSLGAITYRR